tara:strand:- start:1413 stop:2102 length:690 start_codon:yes stop_codon:yes gene_type:complete
LYISNAQKNEIEFKKIFIEIEGEEVYDVSKIVQDHQGYIWMATNLGLIKYNGIEGKKYNKKVNDASIIIGEVGALFVDSQGDIWIGSNSGLSKYNPDCDCIYRYPSIDIDTHLTSVLSITEDKNQDLWFGTQNGELYRYTKENNSITQFLNAPSESINHTETSITNLIVDQNNNLCIGTHSFLPENSLGLIQFNIDTGAIKQFLNEPENPKNLLDNRISALYEDNKAKY